MTKLSEKKFLPRFFNNIKKGYGMTEIREETSIFNQYWRKTDGFLKWREQEQGG